MIQQIIAMKNANLWKNPCWILNFILFLHGTSEGFVVNVYSERSMEGAQQEVSLTSTDCVSKFDPKLVDAISSINTQGKCVHLYTEKDCKGQFLIVKPGTPAHNDFGFYPEFNDKVRSIGLCYPDCHPDYIEQKNSSVFVEYFAHADFKGTKYSHTLNPHTCLATPQRLKRRVSSIKIRGSSCVQIYPNWNCTGESARLFPNKRPLLNNLAFRGFNDDVKSLAICGYECLNESEKLMFLHPKEPPLHSNYVTLFNELDYKGEGIHIIVPKTGCSNLPYEWEGEAQSITLNATCVTLYLEPDCNQRETGESWIMYFSIPDLSAIHGEEKIRSLGPCAQMSKTAQTQKTSKDTGLPSSTIVAIVLGTLAVIGLTCGTFAFFYVTRRNRNQYNNKRLTEKDIEDFLHGSGEEHPEDPTSRPYNSSVYEVPREQIRMDSKRPLGAGAYAVVYSGSLLKQMDNGEKKEVLAAIKMVKSNAGDEYLRAILKEIKTMAFVGSHPHIVELLACCTQNFQAELLVITELCPNGNLAIFLKEHKNVFINFVAKGQISRDEIMKNCKTDYVNLDTPSRSYFTTLHLTEWALQIADGMDYLSSKKVIHGDLAARNILLDSSFIAKIGDFGLSKQLYDYTKYVKKQQAPLPWRWLALEILTNMEFSTESDVWAFAITLFEIFTLGEMPYPGAVWNSEFLCNLKDGLRPSKPVYSSSDCFNLMLECWHENPRMRPTFGVLKEKLSEILGNMKHLITEIESNERTGNKIQYTATACSREVLVTATAQNNEYCEAQEI